jgi:hypothetical protein
LLFGFKIDDDEKIEIADFIVNQHRAPRAYAGTFAPTEMDLRQDLRLFTGERVKSGAGKCHMIGEEASRILRKLEVTSSNIETTLQEADQGLQNRINDHMTKQGGTFGAYCCKTCSCALWLNLASGGLNNNINMLKAGLSFLKNYRDNNDRWARFPYYYTLYVLNEIDPVLAMDEIKYSAKSIEKRLKVKSTAENKYELRRNYICEQLLHKINRNDGFDLSSISDHKI